MFTASIIALIMGAVSSSETSGSFYQTTRDNIPEDSRLHTRRRENLKPPHVSSCPLGEQKRCNNIHLQVCSSSTMEADIPLP
jgi:hypothetical protein